MLKVWTAEWTTSPIFLLMSHDLPETALSSEARQVVRYVNALRDLRQNRPTDDEIGIISPYRKQVSSTQVHEEGWEGCMGGESRTTAFSFLRA